VDILRRLSDAGLHTMLIEPRLNTLTSRFATPLAAIQHNRGLRFRQKANAELREKGAEPKPGTGAGVKRWARYLKRVTQVVTCSS